MFELILAGTIAASPIPSPVQCASGQPNCATGVSASELFLIAVRLEAEGRTGDAEAVLRALTKNPNPDYRAEARYRLGGLLERQGKVQEAIVQYRLLLDEKADAQVVRVTLARLLALTGDESGARRELRRASSGGLPDDVARLVDQFSAALRSRRPVGGSLEVAIAPDTNINNSTRQRTLDTVLAPFDLDEDAQGKSGIGLSVGAQAFARTTLGAVPLLARISGRGDLYGASRFNDLNLSFAAGPEFVTDGNRWRPSVMVGRRWFGGELYSRLTGVTLNWLRPRGSHQVEVEASAIRARYPNRPVQDGNIYQLAVAYDRAFTPKLSGRVTGRATRQTANAEALETSGGGVSLLSAYQFGGQSIFAQIEISGVKADAREALFATPRRDHRLDISAGVLLRQLSYQGLSPLVRVVRTDNRSTVGIYQFSRTRIEFGLSREF